MPYEHVVEAAHVGEAVHVVKVAYVGEAVHVVKVAHVGEAVHVVKVAHFVHLDYVCTYSSEHTVVNIQ